MKQLSKYILSVLLVAFTFFVVHDYYIDDISDITKEQLSYIDCEEKTFSDIHDDIHTMFEVNMAEVVFTNIFSFTKEVRIDTYIFLSYLIFPLDKPPLI